MHYLYISPSTEIRLQNTWDLNSLGKGEVICMVFPFLFISRFPSQVFSRPSNHNYNPTLHIGPFKKRKEWGKEEKDGLELSWGNSFFHLYSFYSIALQPIHLSIWISIGRVLFQSLSHPFFLSLDVNLNQTERERGHLLFFHSHPSPPLPSSFFLSISTHTSLFSSSLPWEFSLPLSFLLHKPSHSLLPNSFNGRIARPVSCLLADMFHLIKPPTTFLVYSILNHPKSSGRMGGGDPPPPNPLLPPHTKLIP